MRAAALSLFFLVPFLLSHAVAGSERVRLKKGAGQSRVIGSCMTCHSLDYIEMHAPVQDRKGWEKTVLKMINVMGAPIRAEDVPEIVGYLTTHYSKKEP